MHGGLRIDSTEFSHPMKSQHPIALLFTTLRGLRIEDFVVLLSNDRSEKQNLKNKHQRATKERAATRNYKQTHPSSTQWLAF